MKRGRRRPRAWNNPKLLPLQTYLQQIVVTIDPMRPEDIGKGGSLSEVSNQTLDAAKITLTMLLILFKSNAADFCLRRGRRRSI